jgi:hypothetical protein
MFASSLVRKADYCCKVIFWLPLAIALTLPALTSIAATGTDTPRDVAVIVDGTLPGFSDEQLAAYVSEQMTASHITVWHFAPASGSANSPNRVIWHFKLLPYAGGTIRYIGPALSRMKGILGVPRAIGIDARVYLDGKYESTTFDQATIQGGPNDASLSRAIQKVLRSVIANAMTFDMQEKTHIS